MPQLVRRRTSRQLRVEQLEARLCLSRSIFERLVHAVDLDGDNDMDVISTSHSDDIVWYENTDGQGTYGPRQVIAAIGWGATSLYAADLDGDGDSDVLSASYGLDNITWYENTNGLGTFGRQHRITNTVSGPTSAYSADVDGDGDMDVLSASYNDGKIAWYQNTDGQGSFGPQQVISNAADGATSVFPADLDGDGDIDVLSASYRDHKIAWYANIDGQGSFGPEQIVKECTGQPCDEFSLWSVYSADLDGDGDMDVLSASQDTRIGWYENTDGRGTFGQQQVIDSVGATAVYAADVDGDGDVDVLSAGGLAWYENRDGRGNFGPRQMFSTAGPATSVYSADLDGDGDIDILSGLSIVEFSAWYENLSPQIAAGDANRDLHFDPQDIVKVLQAAKYLTGEPATFEEGDWNGDGVFDQLDIVAALKTGTYLQGPYAGDRMFLPRTVGSALAAHRP